MAFSINDTNLFPEDSIAGESDFSDVQKWIDLPLNIWYKVIGITLVNSLHGRSYVITVGDREGNNMRYWTTQLIGDEIEKKFLLKQPDKNLFVKSLGKTLNMRQTNSYYNFDLILY